MKKTTLILFTFFYLLVSSGVAINVNYCGSKISSVNFIFSEKDNCGCKSKTNKKCCTTNSHFVKLNDNHQPTSVEKISYILEQNVLACNQILIISAHIKKAYVEINECAVIPLTQPIHLMNSVFLI